MDGYIYGQSIRETDKDFKDWVLNQDGYINDPMYDKFGNPIMYRTMNFDKDGKLIGYEKKAMFF